MQVAQFFHEWRLIKELFIW